MASYRPRSLDDINNSYDSEIKAEKAIKREASKIDPAVRPRHSSDFGLSASSAVNNELKAEKDKVIEDISPAIDELIKQFSQEGGTKKKPNKSVRPLHGVKPSGQTHYGNSARNPSAPAIASSANKPSAHSKPVISSTAQRSSIKSNNRSPVADYDARGSRSDNKFSELMSDYVKIMTDQDEEEEKKSKSLFRKKNRRKAEKEPVAQELSAENKESDSVINAEEESKALYEESENTFDEPVYETAASESSENEFDYEKTANATFIHDEPIDSQAAYQSNEQNNIPEKIETKASDSEEIGEPADMRNSDLENDFDLSAQPDENELETDASEEENAVLFNEDNRDKTSNYEEHSAKRSPARVFFRVLLSVILIVSVLATAAVGSLVLVFHVNEVKAGLADKYYFTSVSNFDSAGIQAGDLVICSKDASSEVEQPVVYVDRENQKFTFGMKSSVVTAEDGEVYYIIDEKAIARDNVVGAVSKSIPTVGRIISIIYSNYTIILIALFAVCVVLFLIVTIALRNKRKISKKTAEQKSIEETYEDYGEEQRHQDSIWDDESENQSDQKISSQNEKDDDAVDSPEGYPDESLRGSYEQENDDDLFSDL